MELRSHAKIIKEARWFIATVTVLVGVAALLFAVLRPQTYTAVVSFEVSFVNRPAVDGIEYQYGSYYDLKGAEIFTQHLMSLMRTPAVVAEVYETAGHDYQIGNISQFTNRFKTSQYSAQNFVVQFTDQNEFAAKGLGEAVATVIQNHAPAAGSINGEPIFEVRADEPVVAVSEHAIWFVTIVGVLAGLLMSLVLVYLREYFRE